MRKLTQQNESNQAAPNEYKARIQWLSPAEGGRRKLPTVAVYRAIPRFREDMNFSYGYWDLVVKLLERPKGTTLKSTAIVSFISDEAPQQLLHVGSAFDLMEGNKTVACGEVIARNELA